MEIRDRFRRRHRIFERTGIGEEESASENEENEREAVAIVKAQLGSALSSSEAVQRWKYFWKSANALRRRGGVNLSSTGGDSNGTMVEAGRKKRVVLW